MPLREEGTVKERLNSDSVDRLSLKWLLKGKERDYPKMESGTIPLWKVLLPYYLWGQKNVSFIRGVNKAKKNKVWGSGRMDLVW